METKQNSALPYGVVGNVQIIAELACVVYDEETRVVIHAHGAVCLKGSEVPEDAAFQQRSLELAQSSGAFKSRRLQTMMVSLADLSGGSLRVDLESRRLIHDDTRPQPMRR